MVHAMPVISIGMPVYNGEKFIREAIDSLLVQTFADFELIISDNASTDATEKICLNYAATDKRIHYIRQKQNIGAGKNFLFVLQQGIGEYFMWAACDDIWDRDYLKVLHNRLKETKESAAFGKLMQINKSSKHLNHPANNRSFQYTGSVLKRRLSFFLEFEGIGKANLIYSLFRRSALAEIDFEKHDADYLILFNILKKTGFLSVNKILFYKRIHEAGMGTMLSKTSEKNNMFRKVLATFLYNLSISKSYLADTRGFEKVIVFLLIPIKMFHVILFYSSPLNKEQ